jgi:mRNA interferase MazF
VQRGEIWVANMNPPRGREIGKIRPAVVIQADEIGPCVTPMVVVLPLTTQVYPAFAEWRVTIHARDRLWKDSQVMADQPRTLDRTRIGAGPLARLTPDEMSAVEVSLKAVLGMF